MTPNFYRRFGRGPAKYPVIKADDVQPAKRGLAACIPTSQFWREMVEIRLVQFGRVPKNELHYQVG
jgi:hypothetical protein